MLLLRGNKSQLEGAECGFKAYLIGQRSLEPLAARKKNKRRFYVKVQLKILRGRASSYTGRISIILPVRTRDPVCERYV